ncbi:putative DNA glycosylase [Gordonia effusa NBRC 100432]|uniref:DNA-(apurinic or apyrimidinic site) lyase n=1 Tax=Gordonia effusa NBRC 100432 TaxID=1077974 RepID=H0R0Q0_9ACTN|nr:DNA-formamidopyrimidine glycosylase family protein [Gordonia effusa]GAB18651.1 putative DNA glycosylase [Gordonia effusa NBRC 100432]
MPEGDTVYRAAARLRRALAGQLLVKTDFRVPALATVDFSGRTVSGVRSRGKHLLVDVESDDKPISIHSHLGMDGAWDIYDRDARWRRPGFKARVVLVTESTQCVGFDLPVLELLTDADAALNYLGPDLLGSDWNATQTISRIAAQPDTPIGVALLDQRLMAGVGNVYRSEICFLRGVLPSRPVRDVDIGPMVELSRKLLYANRDRVERVTTGNTRRGQQLWVYGRRSQPCRRCGNLIVRDTMGESGMERVVYFCPTCQI